ncbi:Chitin synthase export chaperone [Smittium culicis]|uniref:Chitin synthase export chaperone n=1 Tax=Smittium culicis TaxID=133412 RepID=A0A1R1XTI4_9FUNG|nr:Chitin synthase export chaperone [Smittium culicis]
MAVCLLVGDSPLGTKPACYARNIEIGGLIIFQAATLIINVIAIIMTFIMIWHVRTKYTAVGRREMIMVFYLYLALVLLDILTISGFIAFSNPVYPYFVAGYLALTSAMCWCLMLNGFIGFQWAEDGTSSSLWIILVVNTLDEYWPLGNICFAVLFFAAGQVIQLFLSSKICNVIKHYVDGLFFGTICTLLSVMMIYKYWDSITKEDLEFSVGGKGNVWEVKDYINPDDEFAPYAGQINNGAYGDNSGNYGTPNTNQYMSGVVGPNSNNADYGIYSNDSNSYRNNQNTQQYSNY